MSLSASLRVNKLKDGFHNRHTQTDHVCVCVSVSAKKDLFGLAWSGDDDQNRVAIDTSFSVRSANYIWVGQTQRSKSVQREKVVDRTLFTLYSTGRERERSMRKLSSLIRPICSQIVPHFLFLDLPSLFSLSRHVILSVASRKTKKKEKERRRGKKSKANLDLIGQSRTLHQLMLH